MLVGGYANAEGMFHRAVTSAPSSQRALVFGARELSPSPGREDDMFQALH